MTTNPSPMMQDMHDVLVDEVRALLSRRTAIMRSAGGPSEPENRISNEQIVTVVLSVLLAEAVIAADALGARSQLPELIKHANEVYDLVATGRARSRS